MQQAVRLSLVRQYLRIRPLRAWQPAGCLSVSAPTCNAGMHSARSPQCAPQQSPTLHNFARRPRHQINSPALRATSSNSSAPPPQNSSLLNLPTLLTIARVFAIPLLIAAWYWPSPHSAVVCASMFLGASITDWLDGYLARKMNLTSAFGAFLDPVADKLMVAAVLILLCTQPIPVGPWAGNNWLMPVLALTIIGREITMSALREWAATLGPAARAAVAVSNWGKWKTASQMAALTLLLLCKDGGAGTAIEVSATVGPPLLCVASYLTVHSLALYIRGVWRFFV